MLQLFGDHYYEAILKPGYDAQEIIQKEREVFGNDHSSLGGYFLNWWAFPLDIIEMTLYHHNPTDPDISNKPLVALMCVASMIENKEYLKDAAVYTDALEILNTSTEQLNDVIEKYNR